MIVDANIPLYVVDEDSRFHERHAELVSDLVERLDLRGNLVPDAVLAALCLEHGVPVVSADSDFARFADLEWVNPLV